MACRRSISVVAAALAALVLAAACGTGDDDNTPVAGSVGSDGLPAGDDAVIERVVDGDTLVVAGGTRIRLIGIDTPETVHPSKPVECFGREASAVTEQLLAPGTEVRLVYDVERTDRYDRTLAYVYRLDDGLFVNAELLEQGYAQISTFPPNVAHVDEFRDLQTEAREEQRGLWQACDPDLPPPD
ncbi:MAG: thermonuclease family protein [Acidimicrobiia bacterium]